MAGVQPNIQIEQFENGSRRLERIYNGPDYAAADRSKWNEIWEQKYKKDEEEYNYIVDELLSVNRDIGRYKAIRNIAKPGMNFSPAFLSEIPAVYNPNVIVAISGRKEPWEKLYVTMNYLINRETRSHAQLATALRNTFFLEKYLIKETSYEQIINKARSLRQVTYREYDRKMLTDGSLSYLPNGGYWESTK